MKIIKKPDTGTEPEPHLEISLEPHTNGLDNSVVIYGKLSNRGTRHIIADINNNGIRLYGIPSHLGIQTLETAYPAVEFVRTGHNDAADQAANQGDPPW